MIGPDFGGTGGSSLQGPHETNPEMKSRYSVHEIKEALSSLILAMTQLERAGKCCYGISLSQCHIVEILRKKGELTMNELSRRMGLRKSTMTRVVNNMVRKGWIERGKDPEDGRLVHVRLTRKGRTLASTLDAASADCVERILNSIPPAEIPRIIDSVRWIVKSTETELQRQTKPWKRRIQDRPQAAGR